jgi:hypothetical protein
MGVLLILVKPTVSEWPRKRLKSTVFAIENTNSRVNKRGVWWVKNYKINRLSFWLGMDDGSSPTLSAVASGKGCCLNKFSSGRH